MCSVSTSVQHKAVVSLFHSRTSNTSYNYAAHGKITWPLFSVTNTPTHTLLCNSEHTTSLCHKQNTSVNPQTEAHIPSAGSCAHRLGVSPRFPSPVREQPRRLAAVSVNAAPSVKQPLGNVNTQTQSFLHLQRMIIHDRGVFQTLKTWPGSMHHSISTVSSLMRLNPSVNHSDHVSRGGETG